MGDLGRLGSGLAINAVTLDWPTAFLRQAKSDYQMYERLLALDNIPRCQQLHYLQMCTEKLAKGYLTSPGGGPPETDHKFIVRFIHTVRFDSAIRRANHFGASRAEFGQYLRSLRDKAQEVEDLRPRGLHNPNTEYPWDDNQVIMSPLDHGFDSLDPKQDSTMRNLLKFLSNCFNNLDELKWL